MRTTESDINSEIAIQTSPGATHTTSLDPYRHDLCAIISFNNEKSLEMRQPQHAPYKWRDHPTVTRLNAPCGHTGKNCQVSFANSRSINEGEEQFGSHVGEDEDRKRCART